MKEENVKLTSQGTRITAAATFGIVAILMLAVAAIPRVQPANGTTPAVGALLPPLPTQGVLTAPSVTPPVQPSGMGDCPPDWADSEERAVRDTCGKLKEVTSMQQRTSEIATMQAQPYVQTVPNFTPVTLIPPPDYVNIVRGLKFDPYKGPRPFQWRGTTSVWQVGAVPNRDYTTWVALYIVSWPANTAQSVQPAKGNPTSADANPILEMQLLEGLGDGTDAKYYKRWVFPQAANELYITNVIKPNLNITDVNTPFPGLQGVIYLKTNTGQTGSFDLAHETWTLDTQSK
ncbi:MAG TPA: hypothetical protein VGE04_17540 [Chloroflexia bacterium]|jgi:hypothetical protein